MSASRESSVTSFARVMYQKVISANPEILTGNFLREGRPRKITGWKNGRASRRIARITDTIIISRAAAR